MTNIHEIFELSKPLTNREKQIINFYEDKLSDYRSTIEDELYTARDLIDSATHQLTSVENEVVGDLEESLIEHLEEQEADQRRKSVEHYGGRREEIDWLEEVK